MALIRIVAGDPSGSSRRALGSRLIWSNPGWTRQLRAPRRSWRMTASPAKRSLAGGRCDLPDLSLPMSARIASSGLRLSVALRGIS